MSAQGVDGLEGKAGLGEGQEVKAKEGALGALKYMLLCKVMLNLASLTSFLLPHLIFASPPPFLRQNNSQKTSTRFLPSNLP